MRLFIYLIILLPFLSEAQLSDDFSDGNFTLNPIWIGDTSQFQVNSSMELQLDDTIAGQSYLSTPFSKSSLNNLEWRFKIRQSFAASANNNGRVYLASDQSDLTSALNGYYLQFGESGSNDAIELFYQNGSTSTSVARGADASIASSFTIGVRVNRDDLGNWSIYYDPAGGSNYQLDANGTSTAVTSSSFFGVVCNYTASNSTNFYFDDIFGGPQLVDTIAPSYQSITVVSANEIDILFDEALQADTVNNLSNYLVNNGLGNPSNAILDGSNPGLIHLTFANSFVDGLSNNISVFDMTDLNGNTLIAVNTNFTYNMPVTASFRDIIINELLPDPSPQVGLPDAEYLELYNRTTQPIELDNWTLSDLSSTSSLSSFLLQPDAYVIVCSRSDTQLLSPFGDVVAINNLPSLNNGGDIITLKDEGGNTIDSISYDLSWYMDPTKQGGGYSLELRNPDASTNCPQSSNWTASNAIAGGTPGIENSVYDTLPDIVQPVAVSAIALDNETVRLCFSEALQSGPLNNVANFSIDNGIGSPLTAMSDPNNVCVLLTLVNVMTSGNSYTITFNGLSDCSGNSTGNNSITFTFFEAEDADPFDIVITEFFADPSPPVALPEAEFVELYNRSSKVIDLQGWGITDGGTVAIVSKEILMPDEYIIICNVNDTAAFSLFGRVSGTSSFPSLNNDGDDIFLYKNTGQVIDHLSYELSWYVDPGKSDGGFTIERIDPDFTCENSGNWKGSDDQNGGTPGMVNSIFGNFSDNDRPSLNRASVIIPSRIKLHFSEPMDSTILVDLASYTIDNGIGQPSAAVMESANQNNVILTLPISIQNGIIYTITVDANAIDCAGNLLTGNTTAQFAFASPALAGDVIINEILFNPVTGGYDFVELYNVSDKVLELKNMRIANADLSTGFIDNVQPIADEGYLFFPGQYIAITENREQILQQYFTTNPSGIITINDLPTYNNDEGICVILDPALNEIERYRYHEDQHFALLDIVDGVSLERIRFSDLNAWHSASSEVGFATPAYRNSQFSAEIVSNGEVSVSPEVFSPDNDGMDDVININYVFDKPGYVAKIEIYDSRGRLKRELLNNELLGTTGNFTWDGVTSDNEKARVGIYIIYLEAFHPDGDVEEFKIPCVVAARF